MHKSSATRLREENDILRSQNESIMTPALMEKEKLIEEWKLKNQHLLEKIDQLQLENSRLQLDVKVLKESETEKSSKIVKLSQELEHVTNENDQIRSRKEKEIDDLEKKWNRGWSC